MRVHGCREGLDGLSEHRMEVYERGLQAGLKKPSYFV